MAAMFRESDSSTLRGFQKSMDSFGEFMRTPLQTSKTLKHASYTPLPMTSNMSETFNSLFTPGRSGITTPSTKARFGSILGATPRGSFLAQQSITEDITSLNINLLMEDDSGLAACESMFGDFVNCLKSSQNDVFMPVNNYLQICSDNISVLLKLVKKTMPLQNKFSRSDQICTFLQNEWNTWSLISSLFKDRIDSENRMSSDLPSDFNHHVSEKRLTSLLYEQDSSLRQAQIVVDWLESIAEKLLEDNYNRIEFSMDRMGAWENTLHLLKQQKSENQLGMSRNLVTQLDPDAPTRQNKRLCDLDEEDDDKLLHYIFCCVRAGQITEASKVCKKIGQPWRAVTLDGWRLFHDPNMEELGPGGLVQRVEGNQYRDLWKYTCWKISEDENLPAAERAIYAALSGNIKQLLPACTSWQDYVWAYFRVMIDQKVENNIQMQFSGPRPLLALPNTYTDKSFTFESIFSEIESCPVEDIQRQAQYRFHLIQKHIILGDIESLIDAMCGWCKVEVQSVHPHMLRFIAHLVLFFRSIGAAGTKAEQCDTILQAYVNLLIQERHIDLVANYVGHLPHQTQIELYAKFLEGIQGTDLRQHCLRLAEEVDLDISKITKLVVENIRNRDMMELTMDTDLPLETTEEDRQKIEALEWLTFDPSQRSEALRQGNAIMRLFLCLRKLPACNDTAKKIPSDSIDTIFKSWRSKAGDSELPADDANAVREYLCIRAYLDAQESFSDWFDHYHNAKPTPPGRGLGGNFTERVAIEHKQRQYELELVRWQHSVNLRTQATVQKIHNVLLFVDGGWMVDQRKDGAPDNMRTHQMDLLRQLCLPTLCNLLHKLLHTTERYKECLQLANLVASEDYQLYKVFRPEELQKFLQLLRESSVALLDYGLDPLGYPLT